MHLLLSNKDLLGNDVKALGEKLKLGRNKGKKEGSGTEMINCRLAKREAYSKNWYPLLTNLKIQWKNSFTSQSLRLYHYANNNPIKYIDPDGRKLDLYLDKETQTLTIVYRHDNFKLKYDFNSSSITTRVEWGVNNRNVNQNSHVLQENFTKPTQFPNGDWNITGIGPTGDSQYGENWLTTDAFQMLDVYEDDMITIVKNLDGTNMKIRDDGYFIHFTTTNTHGCLGLLDESKMKLLIMLYTANKLTDDPSAMIHVSGDPTRYDPSKDKNKEKVYVEF